MKKSDFIVYVGRFQPWTLAHHFTALKALDCAKALILPIGSYRSTPTIKNPWTYEERVSMIKSALGDLSKKVIFIPIRDHLYDDTAWITELQHKVDVALDRLPGLNKNNGQMIGHFKDDSSYYLNFFPQWPLISEPAFKIDGRTLDATQVRSLIYKSDDYSNLVTPQVKGFLEEYVSDNNSNYVQICAENEFIEGYKALWKGSPYPPTFVTADSVVIQSGHVLVVNRRVNPGKGLWALPGGFVNQNERVEQAALRELKEETGIVVPSAVLNRCITKNHVFDHPKRSLRGRTITHAFLIELDSNQPLPHVKGGDDAESAYWMSFNDLYLNEDKFFEDHLHIIEWFLRKGNEK